MLSKLNDIGTLIISFLVTAAIAGFPEECTVDLLLENVGDESNVRPDTLKSNQVKFNSTCSDGCIHIDVNGIIREQCSKVSSSDYAVYRCPNDHSQFYIADMNIKRCHIKYYTLCSDSASYKDADLDDTVRDLLCGCNPSHLMYNVGNDTCHTVYNATKGLYCRGASTNYIAYKPACPGYGRGRCADETDIDNERFSCDKYGLYCHAGGDSGSRKFFLNSFLCDGEKECDDATDEVNCPSSKGMYCAEDLTTQFIVNDYKCDGYKDCENGADELPEQCLKYCQSADGATTQITITEENMCNGEKDCDDDDDEVNCASSKGMYCDAESERPIDFIVIDSVCDGENDCDDGADESAEKCGISCDKDTKTVSMKDVCQNNICEDGMDMNEKLWNCSKYEICPDPFPNQDLPGDQTVLCDSSIFCKSFNDVDSTLAANCQKCEKGSFDSPERCKDSDNGIVCSYTDPVDESNVKDYFIVKNRVCDGRNDCDGGIDEQDCTKGFYCSKPLKFVRWDKLCNGNIDCDADGLDENAHCESTFFSILKENDPNFTNITEYLNMTRISPWFNDDSLEAMLKHNIFACQEYLYNMDGPKGDVIRKTIAENCINEEKFSCQRVYHSIFPGTSSRIMKSWLCAYSTPGLHCVPGSEKPADEKLHACRSSGLCYSESMRCDGEHDCTDGGGPSDSTDEIGCADQGLKCGGSSTKTVEDPYICDGYNDCESEVDEYICYKNQESSSADCTTFRDTPYLLYSKFTTSYVELKSTTSGQLEQVTEKVVQSCECKNLKGGQYLAAVCSTDPGKKDQPCRDSDVYNSSLCYPSRNGSWYSKMYDTSEMDESCKSLTRTLTGLSHNNSLVQYRTFVKFPNGQNVFLDRSVFCKDPDLRKLKRCGVELDNMCNLMNDCGDWSDESADFCLDNFECKNNDKVSRVISKSQLCDGVTDCDHSQDECLDQCNKDPLTNIERILGQSVALLAIVWIFGTISLIFNFYLIVSMTKSAFAILDKTPHRFIYRMLVATIAFGDIMISIYLVMLACADSFRVAKYCEEKEDWLTGPVCISMGVLSTFGNHVSLFAMVTLSMFRLKIVVHYLWPRTINRIKALRLTSLLVFSILFAAMLISTLPLIASLKDYFVDRFYFPNRRNIVMSTKSELLQTLKAYVSKAHPYSGETLKSSQSWNSLLNEADSLFNGSKLIQGGKPYSFYSAYGVCLFNYLNSHKNNSFTYVISIITLNLVCFVAIITSYLLIWRIGTNSRSTERQLQKKLSIAVSLNIICRLPLFALCLAHVIEGPETQATERCQGTCLYYRYMSVFVIPINSVINPFINSEVPLVELLGLARFFKRSNNKANGCTDTVLPARIDENKSKLTPMIVTSPLAEDIYTEL